jgi:AraC family transcriptional regulator
MRRQASACNSSIHANAHVLLLIKGTYSSSALRRPGPCSEPVIIFHPPGVVHRDRFETDGRLLGISISRKRYAQLDGFCPFPKDPVALDRVEHLSLARRLRHELRSRDNAAALIIEGLSLQILGNIADQSAKKKSRFTPDWLKQVCSLLRSQDPFSPPTLRAIAVEAGVPETELLRSFLITSGVLQANIYAGFASTSVGGCCWTVNSRSRKSPSKLAMLTKLLSPKLSSGQEGCPPGLFRARFRTP